MKLPKPEPQTKLTDAMWDSPRYVAEEKFDGERCWLDGSRGAPRLYSSGNTDRSLAVPHIVRAHKLLEGAALDGEIVAPSRRFGDVVSVLHSGPERAHQVQIETGFVRFHAFDLMAFEGQDLTHRPLRERRKTLETLVARLRNPALVCVPQTAENKREFYRTIVRNGGEGVVLKNLDLMYGLGWVKAKHRADVSAVISHVHADRDAIELSVYDGARLVPIGDCAIPTIELRGQLRATPHRYVGRVLDVSAYELTSHDRLRSPVWMRLRPDVFAADCTLRKVREQLEA